MLRRSYQDRMSNPSESLVGVDTEEDQHLLNEHERQVVDHEETEMELQNLSNHPIKYRGDLTNFVAPFLFPHGQTLGVHVH